MFFSLILGFVLVTRVYLEKEKLLKFLNYNDCKAFRCQSTLIKPLFTYIIMILVTRKSHSSTKGYMGTIQFHKGKGPNPKQQRETKCYYDQMCHTDTQYNKG